MKKLVLAAAGAAAFTGVTAATAQAADFAPAPSYTWAATGFVEGGFGWLDRDFAGPGFDVEVANIVAGGDFLIYLDNGWNLQLGGAWNNSDFTFTADDILDVPNFSANRTEFQANVLAYYRDPSSGLFGGEVGFYEGLFSIDGSTPQFIRLGGVAEYYFSDTMTFGAYGGALLPFSTLSVVDTGFYAGGHLTYYATQDFAMSAFAKYQTTGFSTEDFNFDVSSLRLGGELRYLTAFSGVQLYASGAYYQCDASDIGPVSAGGDGVEFKVGVQIALGGQSGSLVEIDRSNTVDTRTWSCSPPIGVEEEVILPPDII